VQTDAGEAGLDGPVRDVTDLNGRLGTVDKQEKPTTKPSSARNGPGISRPRPSPA